MIAIQKPGAEKAAAQKKKGVVLARVKADQRQDTNLQGQHGRQQFHQRVELGAAMPVGLAHESVADYEPEGDCYVLGGPNLRAFHRELSFARVKAGRRSRAERSPAAKRRHGTH